MPTKDDVLALRKPTLISAHRTAVDAEMAREFNKGIEAAAALFDALPNRGRVCLGTMNDLGIVGVPLDIACEILNSFKNLITGACRYCQTPLVATIHDGSPPGAPRRVGISGDRTICDPCYERVMAGTL